MNVSQALEYERQPFIPMFIYGDHGAMESERQKGEEALKVLETEYFTAEGDPGFDFATVRDLADRNRDLCDQIGEARLRNVTPATLSRGLSDADTCAAIGKMQKRTAASVMREIRGDRDALGVAYARKPIQGTVLGIDIETTGRAPERGYIINVGWEIMELTSDAVPHDAEAHYCGLPDIYRGEDVPLSNIHHITWDDIDGKKPFRENKELQKQLLKLMKKYPYMAHNAAFEDSWFKPTWTATPRHAAPARSSSSTRARSAAAWTPTCARSPASPPPPRSRTGHAVAAPSRPTPTSSIWVWTTPTSCSARYRPSSTSRTYSRNSNACDKHYLLTSGLAAGNTAAGPPYVPQIDLPSQILNTHCERFRPIPDT